MIDLWLGSALAASATLHVGVHAAAGSVYDIAADGASGQCVVGPARISCPADAPVTFRWGPGGPWTLVGQTIVAPGEVGVAFVLASEEARTAERTQLAHRPIDPEVIRRVFVRTGTQEARAPSIGMIDDLTGLAGHPDPRVRRAVLDALVPFWRHTASDPFDAAAPELVGEQLIGQFAEDEDVRVRRRLAARLKDIQEPDQAVAEQVFAALGSLSGDSRASVQRAATASMSQAAGGAAVPSEVAWAMAMQNVTREGPPGRAAANTLKHLRSYLDADQVDATEAVHAALQHHPERAWHVWSAWREEVPFRRPWVDLLLRETAGLDRRLLRYWASREPESLGMALAAWEPAPPHSARWEVLRAWLSDAEDPPLRDILGLPESPPPG